MSKSGLVQSRLDFWLISTHLLYDVDNCKIYPGLKSDHSVVSLIMNIAGSTERGRGFFKFNNSLLQDKSYVDLIKDTIQTFHADNIKMENKGLLWDCLKCKIRGVTISYASAVAKERRKNETELLNRIQQLEISLNEDNIDELNTCKKELEQIYMIKAKDIMLRSKAKLVECDEKPTKYFLRQESENYKNKHICSLIIEDDLITDQSKILKAEKDFYKLLYTCNDKNDSKDDSLFSEILT